MTDRYERIRQALEGLRERCAQEVERITGRRRAVAAMINNEAVKPCEVAAAIREIDVQQYYECALREIEALRAEVDALRKAIDRAWNEGFDFAMKACGWQEGEDPSTEGLYVARDRKGNVEVGMWYAKTVTQPAEWTREFRDVDRDDIVAWMAIPDWRTARDTSKLSEAMPRARENTNDH